MLAMSTTNTIDSTTKITKNYGVITATVVAGTNIIRDTFAAITDIVGGKSGTYINKIDTIKAQVLEDLNQKAQALGANALIGVSIDVDEISGSDKSMFMVTAIGTAVTIE